MFSWLFEGVSPLGQTYMIITLVGLVFLVGILIHDHWWVKRKKQ